MTQYEICINATMETLFHHWSSSGQYTDAQQEQFNQILKEAKSFLMTHQEASIEELIHLQSRNLQEKIDALMEEKKTAGLAFGYQLMNGPQIEFYRGKISLEPTSPYVSAQTKFQLASVTKEILAFFLCTLEQTGMLDFERKVNEFSKGFDKIDATVLQLMNGNVVVSTDQILENGISLERRVSDCSSYEAGLRLLKEAIITKRDTYLYQDNPWMILRELIDAYPSKIDHFLKECDMNHTSYEIKEEDIVTGGKYPNIRLEQDLKAQIMDHAGHSGLCAPLSDLLNLSKRLYQYQLVSKTNVERLITPALSEENILDATGKMRVNHRAVLNRKCLTGLQDGEIHSLASNMAMAKDGFTGTYHVTDIPNGYGMAILTNPLSSHEDGKKPPRYPWTLDTLKEEGTKSVIQLNLIQKVYETCYGKEESQAFQKTYQL